jgi:hypothetical protein
MEKEKLLTMADIYRGSEFVWLETACFFVLFCFAVPGTEPELHG